MYVTLGIILLFFVWALSSFGQKKTMTREELRERMHQRMRDHLIQGFGSQEDIFKDMDTLFNEPLVSQNFQSEWAETSSGRRLTLTPKTPEQKLDLKIENGIITIKGETKEEGMVSEFTNSFSVPDDCDPGRVKISQGKGTIIVDLPFIKTEPKKEVLKPIKPSESDIQI
jgi:HSP20 family molecular chaperone IbpA